MRTLKAAVVGVGAMGQHHARIYNDMPSTELVAVVDRDITRAREIAEKYGCRYSDTIADIVSSDRPDIVSVATPTLHHNRVAVPCIASGIHTLIEKPISTAIMTANDLIAQAQRHGVILAVGHTERYNPAVRAARRILEEGKLGQVYRASFRRLGPSPKRIRDVGVTMDLAIHDIDLALSIMPGEIESVAGAFQYVNTERKPHFAIEDGMAAILRFSSGAIATIEADWLTAAKIRRFSVTCEHGVLLVDLLLGSTTVVQEKGSSYTLTRHSGESEPLLSELEQFARRVNGHPDAQIVTGEDGMRAVSVALQIMNNAQGADK